MRARKAFHQAAAGLCIALAVSGLAAGGASAATTQGNLSASANVTTGGSATLTTQPVAFPSYNPVNTLPTDGGGTVSVTATSGLPYSIGLGGGAAPAEPMRQLQFGINRLAYNLYLDSARSTVWGEGTPTGFDGAVKTATGTGAPQGNSIFARIPPGQNAPAGSYTDNVLVTVTF